MAFHVACPITCRRICFCKLGIRGDGAQLLEEISRVKELLIDPWSSRAGERPTVQVPVPKLALPAPLPAVAADGAPAADGDELLSAQTKRAALQRQALATSKANEDFARRFENGDSRELLGAAAQDLAGEDQGSSDVKIMCRICLSGENEGSVRAKKMLPCKFCNKKYHRNCLRRWAEHRDLFHWNSWACPSCRICEVCRKTGDPKKFVFCKRCDNAYHDYCQYPPRKNVSHGRYLCSKHTRCHSCGSNVPGNGLSTRWFLGYTCCDACGRLFMKGNYCPVCLKVYRDSEATPMVCCDVCQRWVHCRCDGISDEKYLQFQADRNLYYKCAACRGDCYKIKDVDDAVQELWRRRDENDHDLIASLRLAAGLPAEDGLFSVFPYSDDEDNGPIVLKSDSGQSLKFSLKGFGEKTPKNVREYGKKSTKGTNMKYVKKKGYHISLAGKAKDMHLNSNTLDQTEPLESRLEDERVDDLRSTEGLVMISPASTKNPIVVGDNNAFVQPFKTTNSFVQEAVMNSDGRASKVLHTNVNKSHSLDRGDDTGKLSGKVETSKGTKIVIHLGMKNLNKTNLQRPEGPKRDQDLATANGGIKINTVNQSSTKQREPEVCLTKRGTVKPEVLEVYLKGGGGIDKEDSEDTGIDNRMSGKKSGEGGIAAVYTMAEATPGSNDVSFSKHSKATFTNWHGQSNRSACSPVSESLLKDSKPLLRLKFKNLHFDNQSSWVPQGSEEDKSFFKGQRSKRKRPSPSVEKAPVREDERYQRDDPIDEVMDANWILKKSGKDVIGKRVEVHQSSDNSWHKGVVTKMIESSSALHVHLDDGRDRVLERGKQAVHFLPQKQ